jgi:hypothetical protein
MLNQVQRAVSNPITVIDGCLWSCQNFIKKSPVKWQEQLINKLSTVNTEKNAFSI